jgi:hypothetical protein
MLHRSMIRIALIVLATCIALSVALPAGAETPLGIRVDGLRYQAEAYAYGWHPQQISRGETAAGIRADGLRYQAEARVYLLRAGSGGGDSILVYGLIVSGAVLAAAGALLLLRAKSKMTRPSLATSAGGES